jgi:hypothetical protein
MSERPNERTRRRATLRLQLYKRGVRDKQATAALPPIAGLEPPLQVDYSAIGGAHEGRGIRQNG